MSVSGCCLFLYEDKVGNTILIGQDDDRNGLSTTWQTPSNISGSVYAKGIFMASNVRVTRRSQALFKFSIL